MRVILQRVINSKVEVDNKITGSINEGLMVLVGFTYGDDESTIDKMINKVINLRIFDDENGVMNKSLLDINGSILSISQFTLYADTKKGRRPSYINAMNGEESIKLYDLWNKKLNSFVHTETGIFGADMKVSLINDGPTTIFIDSKEF